MYIKAICLGKRAKYILALICIMVFISVILLVKYKQEQLAQKEQIESLAKLVKEQQLEEKQHTKENIAEKETGESSVENEEEKEEDTKIQEEKPREKKLVVPENYAAEEIIAKLEIAKIELVTYIIGETTEETLNKSVTKLCGPEPNQVGNFCITGHNYIQNNMFYKLKNLEVGDIIALTNVYGDKYEYQIYEIEKVMPDNLECLNQETGGEREVTLITCTIGAQKRLIVKAREIYD